MELAARTQKVVAKAVIVDSVTLSAPGYVGVYDDGNGAPGIRLGETALLPKGVHRNVSVHLSKKPTGKSVYVIAHREDNKNSHLDFPSGDAPFVSTTGVVLVKVAIQQK